MEVITSPDLSVGGQAGPHSDDKTRNKTHCEEWKWNLSIVKHHPHGLISCMVKRAVYDALNGDEPFDFENKRGQVFSALSAKDTDITTDKHTRYTFR